MASVIGGDRGYQGRSENVRSTALAISVGQRKYAVRSTDTYVVASAMAACHRKSLAYLVLVITHLLSTS